MPTCVECGSEADISHHISYADDVTVPLCNSCHANVHSNPEHELYPDDDRAEYEQSTVAARVGPKLKAAIDEYAERSDSSRNSAIKALIAKGLMVAETEPGVGLMDDLRLLQEFGKSTERLATRIRIKTDAHEMDSQPDWTEYLADGD